MSIERSASNRVEISEHSDFAFPGDEIIENSLYQEVVRSGYVSSVSTISGAARSLGVAPDNETVERWKRIGASAGLLDDFLDDSPDRDTAYSMYMQGVSGAINMNMTTPDWIDDRLPASLVLLNNSVANLPKRQIDTLRNSALAIGEISRAKKDCSESEHYIDVLRMEAHHTATLVYESASAAMRSRPGFNEFVRWTHSALELGTLYDSARDLSDDYREGRTSTNPNVLNCMRIAMSARFPLISLIRDTQQRRASRASLISRMKYSR